MLVFKENDKEKEHPPQLTVFVVPTQVCNWFHIQLYYYTTYRKVYQGSVSSDT